LTFSDEGLYTCQVRSPNGQAAMSAWLAVTEADENGPATATPTVNPADLPGSPSEPFAVRNEEEAVEVKWDKPMRSGASPIRGYQVNAVFLTEMAEIAFPA